MREFDIRFGECSPGAHCWFGENDKCICGERSRKQSRVDDLQSQLHSSEQAREKAEAAYLETNSRLGMAYEDYRKLNARSVEMEAVCAVLRSALEYVVSWYDAALLRPDEKHSRHPVARRAREVLSLCDTNGVEESVSTNSLVKDNSKRMAALEQVAGLVRNLLDSKEFKHEWPHMHNCFRLALDSLAERRDVAGDV